MSTSLQTFLSAGLGPCPERIPHLIASSQTIDLGPGEPVLRAGDRWSSLCWVEHGVLRLHYLDRQGRSANKNFHLDGALLWPITPALSAEPVDFWIEALVPSRVWKLPFDTWQAHTAAWPAWQDLERRTLAALLDDKMRREQSFLQRTATERYLDLCALRPDWVARIPLRHLASYLGITDVALSRIRRRLNPG